MAQTAPPPSADAPRPLPRRPAGVVKAVRPPRLVLVDGLWMAALAVVASVVTARLPHTVPAQTWVVGSGLSAATTVLLYLLGWRARDRVTGIIAGLLLATGLPFARHAADAPRDALLALLTVASLLSFVAGSSLLALVLAGLATVARPDALLLGLALAGLAMAQRRRFAPLGIGLFALFSGLGWAALVLLGHQHPPALQVEARSGLATWAVAPSVAFLTWMLLPFCAELGEPPRRARWLPVVLWAALYFAASCYIRVGDFAGTLGLLLPLWFVMAGGGLSRLLPALVGEIPLPWVRYLLAAAAVLSLLAMRFRAEAPLLSPVPTAIVETAPAVPASAHPIPAFHSTAPAAVVAPAHPATPLPPPHQVPKPAVKPVPKAAPPAKPKAVVKPAPPDVPLFVRHNGRLVRRSQWAVAWDRAHHGLH